MKSKTIYISGSITNPANGNPRDGWQKDGRMCPDEMTQDEKLDLLRKANRRRKTAERKVHKLRESMRLVKKDFLIAVENRQRTIQEQWEVMKELQRRGIVSSEELEKVIKDVTGMDLIKWTNL